MRKVTFSQFSFYNGRIFRQDRVFFGNLASSGVIRRLLASYSRGNTTMYAENATLSATHDGNGSVCLNVSDGSFVVSAADGEVTLTLV